MEIRQSELQNENAAVRRRVAEGGSFVVTANRRRRALPHTSVVIDFPAARVMQTYRRRRVRAILDQFEVLSLDVTAAEYNGALAVVDLS